eukprot:3568617-Rhodomonas_salina.9
MSPQLDQLATLAIESCPKNDAWDPLRSIVALGDENPLIPDNVTCSPAEMSKFGVRMTLISLYAPATSLENATIDETEKVLPAPRIGLPSRTFFASSIPGVEPRAETMTFAPGDWMLAGLVTRIAKEVSAHEPSEHPGTEVATARVRVPVPCCHAAADEVKHTETEIWVAAPCTRTLSAIEAVIQAPWRVEARTLAAWYIATEKMGGNGLREGKGQHRFCRDIGQHFNLNARSRLRKVDGGRDESRLEGGNAEHGGIEVQCRSEPRKRHSLARLKHVVGSQSDSDCVGVSKDWGRARDVAPCHLWLRRWSQHAAEKFMDRCARA